MNKIFSYGLGFAFAAVSLASCIDETTPTNGVTEEQATQSQSAVESQLLGIHSNMLSIWNEDYDFSFGYPSLMYIRDIETQDVSTPTSNYDQFSYWRTNTYQGQDYVFAQFLWNTQMKDIKLANNVIASIGSDPESETLKGYLGAAYAYRASFYLDMAREYEFLENDKTEPKSPEGNDISGLTVPIVKENITEEEARNNPRATREEMAAFILGDLQTAESNISNLSITDKTLPHLDAVYGLYARYYMWLEDYANAEKYARLAINTTSSTPMAQNDALDTKTGFNTLSKWMWGMQYTKETINNNLFNWFAWACNETSYGYAGAAGAGVQMMIDADLYNKISNADWRKLLWKAPEGSPLYGRNTYSNDALAGYLSDYASLKFRPGNGNVSVYTEGNVGAIPLMRVEEMYLIEAEAAAHQDAARGKSLLETFMKNYRYETYTCNASSTDDVVKEIILQKRIELWGEGQTFFDIKRLNYPVDRAYEGSNHAADQSFVTTTRPAWMNWVMVKREGNGNSAVDGYNNPDPTGKYDTKLQ